MPVAKPKSAPFAPFWQTTDGATVKLWHGNVTDVLTRLPERSVHCVVTSPPYWGLRDYGTAVWTLGNPNCPHALNTASDPSRLKSKDGYAPVAGWTTRDATVRLNAGHKSAPVHKEGFKSPFPGTATGGSSYLEQGALTAGKVPADRACPLGCGAVAADHQLGSEARPDCGAWARGENCAESDWAGGCHVCRMVLVFRGVRRVLRDDGTLWLNYGDTYASGAGGRNRNGKGGIADRPSREFTDRDVPNTECGLPSGNLVGVPWRVALALQADGWVLRQDVIWHKPAPMPESVRNRCTKAHEYVFLLTKSSRYYYDAEAIKERATRSEGDSMPVIGGNKYVATDTGASVQSGGPRTAAERSNKRSVWTCSSSGYEGAHFATFPPKLIEPMILAGTSAKGACGDCGAPWRRVVEETKLVRDRPNDYVKRTGEEGTGNSCANTVAGVDVRTVGWEPTCACGTRDVVPCTVLDPFIGSGTTCAVAVAHGRRSWGVDLSEKYLRENAVVRVRGVLLARPALAHLAPSDRPARKGTAGTPLL